MGTENDHVYSPILPQDVPPSLSPSLPFVCTSLHIRMCIGTQLEPSGRYFLPFRWTCLLCKVKASCVVVPAFSVLSLATLFSTFQLPNSPPPCTFPCRLAKPFCGCVSTTGRLWWFLLRWRSWEKRVGGSKLVGLCLVLSFSHSWALAYFHGLSSPRSFPDVTLIRV